MATKSRTRVPWNQAANGVVIEYGGDQEGVRVIEAGVAPNKPSRLDCNCAAFKMVKPGWTHFCKHVEEVINRGLDGFRVGEPVDLPYMVETVLFVHPQLEPTFVLVMQDPDTGLRRVELPLPGPNPPNQSSAFLGFLARGQGRKLLRNLMQDWLIEQWALHRHSLQCASPIHPMSRKTPHHPIPVFAEEGPDHPTRQDLTNLYDLLTTNRCRRCNEDEGIPEV